VTGWRSLYQTPVRWRQIVEPCDPVLWIDELTSIAFESGFGSVTPDDPGADTEHPLLHECRQGL